MTREQTIVSNRVKQLECLLQNKNSISKRLGELAKGNTIAPDNLSIITSPLFKGVFNGELSESLFASSVSAVDFDKHPKDFFTALNKFLCAKPVKSAPSKTRYIEVMREYGYTLVKNDTSVFGRKGQYAEIIKLFKQHFVDLETNTYISASSNIMNANRAQLEAHSIDIKKTPYDSKQVQTLSEDFIFRVFLKETAIGGELIIKLPRGAKVNMRGANKGAPDYKAIALAYNMQAMGDCGQRDIASYLGESTDERLINQDEYDNNRGYTYQAVSINMIRSLADFKDNTRNKHTLMDYISFCQGEDAPGYESYSEFDKGLGHTLAVGTTAKGIEQLSVTGQGNGAFNGGLLIAGAGSGKTVLYNTLVVQAVALNNSPYMFRGKKCGYHGDGAVVLLDYKMGEWTEGWRSAFNSIGRKLYAFDGRKIPGQYLRQVQIKNSAKSGRTVTVLPITDPIPFYVAGVYFLTHLRGVIRHIYTRAGVASTTEFNKGGFNIDGITKIPRTLCLVDEITSLSEDRAFRKAMQANLFIAQDTRTTNMAWLIGGQDISAQVMPNAKLSNYNYRIVGSLAGMTSTNKAQNRYAYYNVNVPQEIVDYTEQHPQNPLLTHGVFLANNELTKSMYLPEDQNAEALARINELYGSEGMSELEQIVGYGIKHGLFTVNASVTVAGYDETYKGNNILAVALYSLGLITMDELKQMTKETLNHFKTEDSQQETEGGELIEQPSDAYEDNAVSYAAQEQSDQDTSPIFKQNEKQSKQAKPTQRRSKNSVIPSSVGEALFTGQTINNIPLENLAVGAKTHKVTINTEDYITSQSSLKTALARYSPRYVDIVLNDAWRKVLKTAEEAMDTYVTLVELLGDRLFVNKRYIDTSSLTGSDPYGIENKVAFSELVDFGVLFKTYKKLKQLTIDVSFEQKLLAYAGSYGELFEKTKSLTTVRVLARSGAYKDYLRGAVEASVPQSERRSKLNNRINKSRSSGTLKGVAADLGSMVAGHEYVSGAFRRGNQLMRGKGVKSKVFGGIAYVGGTAMAVGGLGFTVMSKAVKGVFNLLAPQ